MTLVRPVDAVACLLPDPQKAQTALVTLREAGHSAFPVRPQPGVPEDLTSWGPDTTILNLYVQGLRRHRTLLVAPTTHAHREEVGRLLSRHGAHAVYYFTATSVECLSVLV